MLKNSSNHFSIFDFFFKTNKAEAISATTEKNPYVWSEKIDKRAHSANTSGDLSFLLKGLTPSTTYEFRAVIQNDKTSNIKYGAVGLFTTKNSSTINPGGDEIGEEFVDPCANTDTDINCNGTGSDETGGEINNSNMPDLTADKVNVASTILNTPTVISALIKNIGKASTIPVPVKNINNNNIKNSNTTSTGAVSILKDFFTNKAIAAVNTTSNPPTGINDTSSTVNNFYNFFQVSTKNQNSYPGDIANTDSSIVNFPAIVMAPLGAKSSRAMTQNYTFTSIGTYFIRACADKKSPTDNGLVKESYENNNCGPWTPITISNANTNSFTCTNTSALNYGLPLPCVLKSGMCLNPNASNYGGTLPCKINDPSVTCTNTSALNYGLPLPCVLKSGMCLNPYASNYGNSLPCDTSTNNQWNNNTNPTTDPSNLKIGDYATPPELAIVRYHEGIETVLQRQIVADTTLAKNYGYQESADLQNFAWNLSDLLAKTFGYVNSSRKEIRVSLPDIAAYQLYTNNGILTIYEYFDGKIVNIQKMTDALRSKYEYEYYFNKK
jgi:hypothetical protein